MPKKSRYPEQNDQSANAFERLVMMATIDESADVNCEEDGR